MKANAKQLVEAIKEAGYNYYGEQPKLWEGETCTRIYFGRRHFITVITNAEGEIEALSHLGARGKGFAINYSAVEEVEAILAGLNAKLEAEAAAVEAEAAAPVKAADVVAVAANVIACEDNAGGMLLYVEVAGKPIFVACYDDPAHLRADYDAALANPAEAATWEESDDILDDIAKCHAWSEYDLADEDTRARARIAVLEDYKGRVIADTGVHYMSRMGCAGKAAFGADN